MSSLRTFCIQLARDFDLIDSGNSYGKLTKQGKGDDNRLAQPWDDARYADHKANAMSGTNERFTRITPVQYTRTGLVAVDQRPSMSVGGNTSLASKVHVAREIGSACAEMLAYHEHELGGFTATSKGLAVIRPGATANKVASAIQSGRFSLEDQLELVAERYVCKLEYLLLVGDFLSGVNYELYRLLAKYTEIVAIQVTDPWDRDLPDLGEIKVNGVVYDTSDLQSRTNYAATAQLKQDKLSGLFEEIGAQHYVFRTDQPIGPQLQANFTPRRQLRRAS